MIFNPNLFNQATREDRVSRIAQDLGYDIDDIMSETAADMTQKIISTKEYFRMSQQVASEEKTKEKINNNFATENNITSNSGESLYRLVGRDEYRLEFRDRKGINIKPEIEYELNSTISPEQLFKGNDFALKQMPKIYESETGDIWCLDIKQ